MNCTQSFSHGLGYNISSGPVFWPIFIGGISLFPNAVDLVSLLVVVLHASFLITFRMFRSISSSAGRRINFAPSWRARFDVPRKLPSPSHHQVLQQPLAVEIDHHQPNPFLHAQHPINSTFSVTCLQRTGTRSAKTARGPSASWMRRRSKSTDTTGRSSSCLTQSFPRSTGRPISSRTRGTWSSLL